MRARASGICLWWAVNNSSTASASIATAIGFGWTEISLDKNEEDHPPQRRLLPFLSENL